jgi:anti-sigma factor RsiW
MTLGPIDHLTIDAVVAYVDGEMSMIPFQRAAAHLARCAQCDAEVKAQVAARTRLRSAQSPAMPSSLLDALRSIPVALPMQAAETNRGTASSHDGGPRHPGTPHARPAQRSRRFRFLGAGALVAGLTVGALAGAAEPAAEPSGPRDGGAQVAQPSSAVSSPHVVTAGWGNP